MRKSPLVPIFLVYFLDNFSFAVAFPLFSTLVLSSNSVLFPSDYTLIMRNMLFGVLSGAFPLGMFFGAPLIGTLSDNWGRKKGFYLTLTGIILGNLLTVLSLEYSLYYLLVLSRLLTGFFSANLTLCLAAISDLTTHAKRRATHFGLLLGVGGLSWIIAMVAGGFAPVVQLQHHTLPFLIAAGIACINLILMATLFTETHTLHSTTRHLSDAFRKTRVRRLFAILLLFSAGWLIVLPWFAGFSLEKFHTDKNTLVTSLSAIGLCWILGSTLINRIAVATLKLRTIPFATLLILAILLILTGKFQYYPIYVTLNCLMTLIAPVALTNILNSISIHNSQLTQGKTLGISQSVIAAAQFIAPMLGAIFLISGFAYFYIYIAAILFISFAIMWSEMKLLEQ